MSVVATMPLRRCFRRLCNLQGENGSSLVEVALTLPVLFLMMFGFINFALIMYGVCNATYASRAAVRYASLHSNTSYWPASTQDVANVVTPYLGAYPQTSQSTSVTYSGGNVVGSTVTVKIAISYRVMAPGASKNAIPVAITATGVVVQ